jgi:hypothetical protein
VDVLEDGFAGFGRLRPVPEDPLPDVLADRGGNVVPNAETLQNAFRVGKRRRVPMGRPGSDGFQIVFEDVGQDEADDRRGPGGLRQVPALDGREVFPDRVEFADVGPGLEKGFCPPG